MFSIFETLASISIKIKNLILSNRVDSPNVNFGKKNVFLKQNLEIKPRSKGPYLLIQDNKLENDKGDWMCFNFRIINLGSEPANNTQTRTEIYINNELKFKSPVSAFSIIPPDHFLMVLSEDPKELVKQCTIAHPENQFLFITEYLDRNGNKFATLKSLFFIPERNILSNREEKALMLSGSLYDQVLSLMLSKKIVTLEDLRIFKNQGFKIEDFLNYLNKNRGYLFHGSGTLIPENEKLISKRGILHATDDGGVAIIKALFPNNLPGQINLDYKLDKSGVQEIIIEGKPEGEVIRQKGYIYVLENDGFSNKGTQGVAEYIKSLPEGKTQDYLFIIEVEKSDFNYSYKVVEK